MQKAIINNLLTKNLFLLQKNQIFHSSSIIKLQKYSFCSQNQQNIKNQQQKTELKEDEQQISSSSNSNNFIDYLKLGLGSVLLLSGIYLVLFPSLFQPQKEVKKDIEEDLEDQENFQKQLFDNENQDQQNSEQQKVNQLIIKEQLKNLENEIKDPKNEKKLDILYCKKGVFLSQLQEQEQAKEAFEKSLEINDKFWESQFNLGIIYHKLNDKQKCQKYLEKSLEIQPDDLQLYIQIGAIFSAQGKLDTAIDIYNKGLKKFPTDTTLLFHKSLMLGDQGATIESVQILDELVKQFPEQIEFHQERLAQNFALKNYEKAFQSCQIIIKIQPGISEDYCKELETLRFLNKPQND